MCASPRQPVDDEREEQGGARNSHRTAGQRTCPPLRKRAVDERRDAEHREQERWRSDADQEEHYERKIRHLLVCLVSHT